MNCDEFLSVLSPYCDGELTSHSAEQAELHVSRCSQCHFELDRLRRLNDVIHQTEVPVETDGLWQVIAPQLNPSVRKSSLVSSLKLVQLAIAASLLAMIGGWYAWSVSNTGHDHTELAVDFKNVIEAARNSPEIAVAGLVTKYRGQKLTGNQLTQVLGYAPATSRVIPVGFRNDATYVLNMPCCKCSATICKRDDESSVIVFEHRDEQPAWFGEIASKDTTCSGIHCKLFQYDGQLASTWSHKGRQLTLIGASNLEEVNAWVETLQM